MLTKIPLMSMMRWTVPVETLAKTSIEPLPFAGTIAKLPRCVSVVIQLRFETLGRAAPVGKAVRNPPLALLLSQKRPTANAAVTVVHTGVPDWPEYTKRAEIVIAAAGVPGILQPEHITPGCVVVGGGVRYEGRRLLPDVDVACEEVAGFITPRVGGVGPTTIAMLFRNLVEIAERRS